MPTILCATDFSENALHALRYALRLAQKLPAQLTILHCAEIPPLRREPSARLPILPPVPPPAPTQLQDLAGEWAQFPQVSVAHESTSGSAGEAIVAAAHRLSASLIVMGCTGLGPRRHLLAGATARQVTRLARCPVLCVPTGALYQDIHRLVVAADSRADLARSAASVANLARQFDAEAILVLLDGPTPAWADKPFQEKLLRARRAANYSQFFIIQATHPTMVAKLENQVKQRPTEWLGAFALGRSRGSPIPPSVAEALAFQHRLPWLTLPDPGRPLWPRASGLLRPWRRAAAASTMAADHNLAPFQNAHQWQRCFVVGNGPSLNRMDLGKLAGEFVFCTNAFFLMFPRLRWRPQYYACVDTRVLPDRAPDILKMHRRHPDMVCFFPRQLLNYQTRATLPTTQIIPPAPNRLYFNEVPRQAGPLPLSAFSLAADQQVFQPYTVTITALQLAYFLGFEPIYLIGCDTDYAVPPTVIQEGKETPLGKMFYTSTANDDPNHFSPKYFGKGKKWHNPQVANMLWHYGIAHEALALAGRHVYNATLGGRLEAFPRVDYDDLF